MTEIHFTDIYGHIRSCCKTGFAAFYLIHGDPYLRRQAVDALAAAILPDADLRPVYMETVEPGDNGGASDAVERAGTYSFFSGPKMVVFKAGDLGKQNREQAEVLKSALKRGLPENHFLIVEADGIDKRTGLYKEFKNSGTVVDCSIPSGNKKAERDARRRILQVIASQVTKEHGKTLDNDAFDKIDELIGPNPGSFAAALDKLAVFAKERGRITKKDVDAVLTQSREDPVYLFTNALGEKNSNLALYYLDSLLCSGFYYAQLLFAMANQVRRLAAVKGFLAGSGGRLWEPGMPFERFKKQVMPAVIDHDKAVSEFAEDVGKNLQCESRTEMLVAKNPNNPYPVYQNFIQADHYTAKELDEAIYTLHRADIRLKTTGYSPRYVLETAILEICNT
ncbi:MAG: DNA polymerase III subunit delta [Desulfobacteraceae bacterium]|nr:DNA polymerase III subunit delta [Desulfobacteraceae bacterium]